MRSVALSLLFFLPPPFFEAFFVDGPLARRSALTNATRLTYRLMPEEPGGPWRSAVYEWDRHRDWDFGDGSRPFRLITSWPPQPRDPKSPVTVKELH